MLHCIVRVVTTTRLTCSGALLRILGRTGIGQVKIAMLLGFAITMAAGSADVHAQSTNSPWPWGTSGLKKIDPNAPKQKINEGTGDLATAYYERLEKEIGFPRTNLTDLLIYITAGGQYTARQFETMEPMVTSAGNTFGYNYQLGDNPIWMVSRFFAPKIVNYSTAHRSTQPLHAGWRKLVYLDVTPYSDAARNGISGAYILFNYFQQDPSKDPFHDGAESGSNQVILVPNFSDTPDYGGITRKYIEGKVDTAYFAVYGSHTDGYPLINALKAGFDIPAEDKGLTAFHAPNACAQCHGQPKGFPSVSNVSSSGDIAISLLKKRGGEVYQERCSGCHGVDGKGSEYFPAIVGSGIATGDRNKHIEIVYSGKEKTSMPAWNGRLSLKDMASVITYQRTVLNKSDVVQPDDIAKSLGLPDEQGTEPKEVFASVKPNYLDTDHWYDAERYDFPEVAKGPYDPVYDGGRDHNSPQYKEAMRVIGLINEQIKRDTHVETSAADGVTKWLELRQRPNGHLPAPPIKRGLGNNTWDSRNTLDVVLLETLNRNCFRCHGSIAYNVFDKKSTFARQGLIKGYLLKNRSDPFYMPQGRILDDADGGCLKAGFGWEDTNGMENWLCDDSPIARRVLACHADFNGDKRVDIYDQSALIVNWGPCVSGECRWDLTKDGRVDIADQSELLVSWGACPVLGESEF